MMRGTFFLACASLILAQLQLATAWGVHPRLQQEYRLSCFGECPALHSVWAARSRLCFSRAVASHDAALSFLERASHYPRTLNHIPQGTFTEFLPLNVLPCGVQEAARPGVAIPTSAAATVDTPPSSSTTSAATGRTSRRLTTCPSGSALWKSEVGASLWRTTSGGAQPEHGYHLMWPP